MQALKVVTFNMHKGMSPLNRRVHLEDIAHALAHQQPDVVFLQEVQGQNLRRAGQHVGWSRLPQHHFLAHRLRLRAVYGQNASYDHGHHGNALLSRYPINYWCNLDLSVNRYEERGLLHVQFTPKGWPRAVVALCAHLNLLSHDRRKQYRALVRYIRQNVPEDAPLILAGDFNDWRGVATAHLRDELGLAEVHQQLQGKHARSFPARFPMLALDRIYVRGLQPVEARVLSHHPWPTLSDHLPLGALLLPDHPISG